MKLSDIKFDAQDCCGVHESAHVTLASGQEIGLQRGDDVYTITYYKDGGVTGREARVDAARVEVVLAC